eukprot:CAMPEP_0185911426 /NCGR_PEP_ID=MMETSP0196C-20130402/28935_1 /TAXON_ID=2932 /ORGANISM="Alexandrium fundyense, Strain CCMP1719" /LENGTH=58 /DNA_ID=CAMNT_0028632477 /DNA_START=36 /DNA_END=208 /DNA_ORIENTATION=-
MGTSAPQPAAPQPVAPKLEDAKTRVVSSPTFVRKVTELCRGAAMEELSKCKQLAGDRL